MASTLLSLPGPRPSMTERFAQVCVHALRLATETLESRLSCTHGARRFSPGASHPPLSPTQWRLLAGAVTTGERLSTWSLTWREGRNYWRAFGAGGEDSGPQVTVFISVMSDSPTHPPECESSLLAK